LIAGSAPLGLQQCGDDRCPFRRKLARRRFAPTPPRGVCPPTDFTPDLLAQVVTAYADTHEDGPAPAAIGQAIVRFFPCPEQKR